MKITRFHGRHRFLSNFWPSVVAMDGLEYATVEHAYQAAKTLNRTHRRAIRAAQTAGGAKRLGKLVTLRSDWEQIKIPTMTDLVEKKFSRGLLRQMLLDTDDAELVEGNGWNDQFWGVCRGVGLNHLGIILMNTRTKLRLQQEPELEL